MNVRTEGHHARVFKIQASRWSWRLECACGEWQQADRWRPVFDWAFKHVEAGQLRDLRIAAGLSVNRVAAQAWLERQADRYMEQGEFTSDVPPGVSGLCVEFDIRPGGLTADVRYGFFEPAPLKFHATHLGDELVVVREWRIQSRP